MLELAKKLQTVLGLTPTEVTIYVAALPHLSLGVQDVVTLTGIKRTTVYHALDTLTYKGFATKKQQHNRTVFSMVSPQFLQHALRSEQQKIEEQQLELQTLVPELENLKKNQLVTTQVQHFHGVAGVKAVYEEALYCASRHWDTITPTTSFLAQYGEDFHRYVNQTKAKRQLHTRALWEEVKKNKPRSQYGEPGTRAVRLMPASMQGRFHSKIIIFDTKIALITPAADAGAVLIHSAELHAAFQALFDTLWEIARPVELR